MRWAALVMTAAVGMLGPQIISFAKADDLSLTQEPNVHSRTWEYKTESSASYDLSVTTGGAWSGSLGSGLGVPRVFRQAQRAPDQNCRQAKMAPVN